jgi:hypothetical protein
MPAYRNRAIAIAQRREAAEQARLISGLSALSLLALATLLGGELLLLINP